MDDLQAHERWLISTALTDHGEGSAVVSVRLTNGLAGVIGPFDMRVDWKPGMEPVDVQVLALNILASGAKGLTDEAVRESARLLIKPQ